MIPVRLTLPTGLIVLSLALPLPVRGDDSTHGADEAALREAGLETNGPALLQFFRQRTLSLADQARLAAAVRRLGDNHYPVREKASQDLIAADRAALPYLRLAVKDPDLEIARRAQRGVDAIENGPGITLELACARLLALRHPSGTTETVLNYLPFADSEDIEEELLATLAVAGIRDGRTDPHLVEALNDARTALRSAAALVLGQSPVAEQRVLVRPLLNDLDAKVRLRAAQGLATAKEKQTIPVFIALLGDAPLAHALQAEELLFLMASEQAPRATETAPGVAALFGDRPLAAAGRLALLQALDPREHMPQISIGAGSAEERRKSHQAWSEWWDVQGHRIDLAQVDLQKRPLGLTLVIAYDGYTNGQGRVWEFGADRRPRWSIDANIQGPIDGQILPGNRLLLAEYNAARVTERDFKGKILWEYHVNGNPVACQRLTNGNTFIATLNTVLEITHQGKEVYRFTTQQSQVTFAQKLLNGRILQVASNGMLTEMDDAGKVIKSVRVGGNGVEWLTFERLPGGRFLIPQQSSSRLVEYDANGKVLRTVAVPFPPYSATRQRNGNTIVCSMNNSSVFEVNRAGKVIWQEPLQGRPFRVARR